MSEEEIEKEVEETTKVVAEAGTANAAESAPGMPQLDFSTFPNQIFCIHKNQDSISLFQAHSKI